MPQHAERANYYAHIDKKAMTSLWESLHALAPVEPTTACAPALWRWDAVYAGLQLSMAWRTLWPPPRLCRQKLAQHRCHCFLCGRRQDCCP